MYDDLKNDIKEEIDALPSGGISYKKINGKAYAYYQWREDGKQKSRRVKDDELEALASLIDKRKQLQGLLRESSVSYTYKVREAAYDYRCAIRLGSDLDAFVRPVAQWKKRNCYEQLERYIYSDIHDRVFILYGLRRTGKTTLIRQLIHNMNSEARAKTAFIQIQEHITLADVQKDLRYLEKQGYRYIFIDEVTLLADFIEGAALFSDIFAASGMKIVLSGTDSLGFRFSEDEELYDRCIMIHTTFIPYHEFEQVLGIKGIDQYIQYGGTMSMSGHYYNNDQSIFSSKKTTDEYVDSAIAKNIQHSLKNYQSGGHFRSLYALYEAGELTNVINRIVEDMNHRFTMEVLTRDFTSHDIQVSARNLRSDKNAPSDVLDHIDIKQVTDTLMHLLDIKNKNDQQVSIEDSHRYEIKEYLELLDLTVDVSNRWMSDFNKSGGRTVFTQPGLRYSQAKALIVSLLQDDVFRKLSFSERKRVTDRILDEVKGRMMEDIILLETKALRPHKEVFSLQFAIGEFDMVVFDPEQGCCEIFEIKHSREIVEQQCRHLVDAKKCRDTEFRYGPIKDKYVIYRGETQDIQVSGEKIRYLNVEEYLNMLNTQAWRDKKL